MDQRVPVILDTDIGSDIDDAVALSYLLRQPRCELVGITTVTGDVAQRAGCADVIC
jgi:purine nucleosidase